MTKQEFEKYLKSIGGLENGYFNDKKPITSPYYFSIGEGWYQLVKDLIEELISLGWDKQITDIKEKFGGLRFYIVSGTDEMFNAISRAEEKSFEICEKCGEKAKLQSNGHWLFTLCDECFKSVKK